MVVHQFLFTPSNSCDHGVSGAFLVVKNSNKKVTTWKITKYSATGDSDSFPLICWLFLPFPLVVFLGYKIKKNSKLHPSENFTPNKAPSIRWFSPTVRHLDAESFPIAIVAIAFGVLDGKTQVATV